MSWPVNWSSLEELAHEDFEEWRSQTSAKDACGQMRVMWWDVDPSCPPPRQRPVEQQRGERRDSLRPMPQQGACSDGDAQTTSPESMSSVFDDVQAKEGKRQIVQEPGLCQGVGETISRTAVGIKNRADRLKAIGNGQVPAVVVEAWKRLMGQL